MNNFITYKNAQIHFSDAGEGEVVVLLHGFLEDISMWDFIVEALKPKYRIICVDLFGHGKSDCLGYVHTMEAMADSVKFVLDTLKISKATYIGHSMGGYVALALAEKNKDLIKGLCLMNATAQADSEERKNLRNRAVKMAQVNYEPLVSMSVGNLFSQETRSIFLSAIEKSKKTALQTKVQAYIACTEGMKLRENREAVLLSGNFKKLIIAGKKDPVLLYKSIVEESERTNTPIISLSNGHMSHIENGPELIHVLESFLLLEE